MKRAWFIILLIVQTHLLFAQLTSSGSISEGYRNLIVQSTSFLNPRQLSSFEPVGGPGRFFSAKWEKGSVKTVNNVLIDYAEYEINYDFYKHELYTKWKDTIIVADNQYLKSFCIYQNRSKHCFYQIPEIEEDTFIELLSSDTLFDKIRLLKAYDSHLKHGDKASPGNNYLGNYSDTYNLTIQYFLMFPDKNFVRIKLNNKSILENLKSEYRSKAIAILNSNKISSETEAISLINKLNQ